MLLKACWMGTFIKEDKEHEFDPSMMSSLQLWFLFPAEESALLICFTRAWDSSESAFSGCFEKLKSPSTRSTPKNFVSYLKNASLLVKGTGL